MKILKGGLQFMKDKIIEKVKKLFRLAGSDNENEAALALKNAEKLMKAQNITLLEKTEVLTTLRRNEVYAVSFRIPGHLPGQPESARSGQVVRFFHIY